MHIHFKYVGRIGFFLPIVHCMKIACLQINISKSVQLYVFKRIERKEKKWKEIVESRYKKQLNNVHMLSVFTWIHFLCFRLSSRSFLSNFLYFFFSFTFYGKCNWNGNIQIHMCNCACIFLCSGLQNCFGIADSKWTMWLRRINYSVNNASSKQQQKLIHTCYLKLWNRNIPGIEMRVGKIC